jgi:hypothetical protein
MPSGWRGQYYRYKDLFLNVVTLYKQRRDLQAFLELILSVSTVIIFIVFALRPTALTIVSLYNQIQEKQKTLDALKQKVTNLQTANNVFEQEKGIIPDIDAAVFGVPEPDTISKQITGLGIKDSVSVLGVSVGQVMLVGKSTIPKDLSLKPLPGNAFSMPVSISAKGDYLNLLTFLKDLESLRVPVKIDSLTVNSSQTEGGSAIVGVITARVPYIGN